MPHSQGLSNNPYPEPNQPNYLQLPALTPISSRSILTLSSHLRLGLPKGLFPIKVQIFNFFFQIQWQNQGLFDQYNDPSGRTEIWLTVFFHL